MHVVLYRSPFENKYPHMNAKVGFQVFLVYLVCTIGLQAVFPTSFMSMQCAVVAFYSCPSPLLVSFGRYYLQSRGNLPTA